MIFCGLEIADVIEKNIFLLKTSAESLPYLWEKLGMKEFLLKLVVSDWKHLNGGLLLLRLFAGGMMLTHGWAKLSSFTDLSVTFPDPLGVGNTFSLVLNVFAEVGCSLCLILGFVTRLAVLPLIFNMAMAFFYHSWCGCFCCKGNGVALPGDVCRCVLGRRREICR